MNRIFFADNPWPHGHAIKELVWSARLDPEIGVWFDLHLKSDDYYAEDDDSYGEDEEYKSDWNSKIVWNNYHQCILSSTYWGHKGFLAATAKGPLDFTAISDRTFDLDPLPPPDEPFDRAFGIYLLGHDGAADHHIRFTPKDDNSYELDWRGKIALEYAGSDTFNYTFHARYNRLKFAGIKMPDGTKSSDAVSLLEPFLVDTSRLEFIQKEDSLWISLS